MHQPDENPDMANFRLADIKPNPFRHIDRYPIQREKVGALRESYRVTGYWGNIVARLMGSTAEIAYGHHRLVALREEYGEDQEISLLIHDLDDEAMLQIMARENMEQWGTSAAVEQETVRAVVEAYAAGKINLPPKPEGTSRTIWRAAPGFQKSARVFEKAYTAEQIAQFLGWQEYKAR